MREQEEQQEHEHQIESEESNSVQRPKAKECRFWELEKLKTLSAASSASPASSRTIETSLLHFPSFAKIAEILIDQIGASGAASNFVKRKSILDALEEKVHLRFSPNSRLTSEFPILQPILMALELRGRTKSLPTVVALSLAEAESLRWALERLRQLRDRDEKIRDGLGDFDFTLFMVSESPIFDTDQLVALRKVTCFFFCFFATLFAENISDHIKSSAHAQSSYFF